MVRFRCGNEVVEVGGGDRARSQCFNKACVGRVADKSEGLKAKLVGLKAKLEGLNVGLVCIKTDWV